MSLLEGFQANWGSTLKKTLVIDGAWYKYDDDGKNLAPENFFFEISIILLTIGIFEEIFLVKTFFPFLVVSFYLSHFLIGQSRHLGRASEYVLYLAV